MCAKTRKSERYDVIGKVESDELSAFSGTVLNISSQGCWIHYAAPVTVSLENEYTVKIYLLRRYPLFKRLRFFRIHFWQGNCSAERSRAGRKTQVHLWRGSSSLFLWTSLSGGAFSTKWWRSSVRWASSTNAFLSKKGIYIQNSPDLFVSSLWLGVSWKLGVGTDNW